MSYFLIPIAAIVSFIFGAIWYGPLFGSIWQKHSNITQNQMKSGDFYFIFGLTFVCLLVMAMGMMDSIKQLRDWEKQSKKWQDGALLGIYLGLIFILPSMSINALYSKKSWIVLAIDASYQILCLIIMGSIIGQYR